MPLPMPEEEELHPFAPTESDAKALMLCSLDCATSGAHPDRKTKADGRFIVTPWWCIHKCKWFSEHKNEAPKSPDPSNRKNPPNKRLGIFIKQSLQNLLLQPRHKGT